MGRMEKNDQTYIPNNEKKKHKRLAQPPALPPPLPLLPPPPPLTLRPPLRNLDVCSPAVQARQSAGFTSTTKLAERVHPHPAQSVCTTMPYNVRARRGEPTRMPQKTRKKKNDKTKKLEKKKNKKNTHTPNTVGRWFRHTKPSKYRRYS